MFPNFSFFSRNTILHQPLSGVDEKEQYMNLGSAWYVVKAYKREDVTLITGILIRTDFPFSNSFVESRTNRSFRLPGHCSIVPLNLDEGFIVFGKDDGVLFTILSDTSMQTYSEAVILRWLADLFVRLTRTLDWPLLAALAALMGIGLAVLHSAGGQNMSLVRSQAARYLVGLGAMWLLSRIPPLPLRRATPAVYAVSLLPLVAVLFIGTGRSGAHWINLGLFYFQPAELMKLSLPMMAAWMLSQAPLPPRMGTILATGAVIAIPTALILAQPDFGTAMLVVASGVFALYLAGMSWVWFAIAGVGAATAAGLALFAPISWFSFLRPYQQDRILTFRDPENDPLGAGWNIIQSKIAIGSGGFTGQGWGKGTQSHLNYVPEHTTDFIFAVLAEEFGWVGVATVLALYGFVIGRCLWIAAEARDAYARILAGTLGLALFVYVVVNGGMISGLLPVVGVPMPLLSFGGTAAVSLLAGQGASLAIGGAYALGQALDRHADLETGLQAYEELVRPEALRKQAAGRRTASWFVPSSAFKVWVRALVFNLSALPFFSRIIESFVATSPKGIFSPGKG